LTAGGRRRGPSRLYAFGMGPIALLAVSVALGFAAEPSPSPSPSPDPTAILDRAIKAAGGEERLRRATVLRWRGHAFVHAGDRRIEIEGRWILEPPDRAVAETWEVGKGKNTTRRLIVLGSEGWMERAGERTPMPPAMLASERGQFYLYSVMRLLPLRDAGVRLTATGPRSLRVEREGRPAVEMTFDGTGFLDRMRTQVADPVSGRPAVEVITFEGVVEGGGVRWPRRMSITRDGEPYFDLELTELSIGTSEELAREARPRQR
jgi:hypothetical protein